MTILANIVTAIVQTLQAGPAVANQVSRVRLRPLSASTTTAVVVRATSASAGDTTLDGRVISWQAQIQVECYARSAGASMPDMPVDSLLGTVSARLLADPTLGGVLLQLQPQTVDIEYDVDADQTACATLTFTALALSPGNLI